MIGTIYIEAYHLSFWYMSRNACSNENGENSVKNRQIRQANFASTNLTKTRQTRQFRQADCALTNLTILCQNRQIHKHLLGLTNLPFLLLRAYLDIIGWIWVRVLAQESVHLFYIFLSDFKTINISVIIANTAYKIQLSGTGNYRGLKKLGQRSLGKDPSSISLETVWSTQNPPTPKGNQ